jgi:phage shock protein E
MKLFIKKNKLTLLGGLIGAIVGFLYWFIIGCSSGSCAITSKPINSTIYFAVLSGLIFSIFQKDKKTKST